MSSPAPPLRVHDDYTIACICPMGVELAPVEAMLDEIHPDLPTRRDHNSYILGSMEGHNIVVVVMPEIGNNAAATVASQLLNDFPSIRFGLLVGIGGGVPGDGSENDIHLGDIVVSKPIDTFGGVVQYDLGKKLADGTFLRTGTLNRPPPLLSASVQRLQARHFMQGDQVGPYLHAMMERFPKMRPRYSRPSEPDMLFLPSYIHPKNVKTCHQCDRDQLVAREPRHEDRPYVHYGTIASANLLIKSATDRDALRHHMNVLCIEMEAAGIMNDFPCLVIRGICDYADSHKNKKWQPYAAAVAAAYMKELLSIIPARGVVNSETATQSTIIDVPARPNSSQPTVRSFQELRLSADDVDDGGSRDRSNLQSLSVDRMSPSHRHSMSDTLLATRQPRHSSPLADYDDADRPLSRDYRSRRVRREKAQARSPDGQAAEPSLSDSASSDSLRMLASRSRGEDESGIIRKGRDPPVPSREPADLSADNGRKRPGPRRLHPHYDDLYAERGSSRLSYDIPQAMAESSWLEKEKSESARKMEEYFEWARLEKEYAENKPSATEFAVPIYRFEHNKRKSEIEAKEYTERELPAKEDAVREQDRTGRSTTSSALSDPRAQYVWLIDVNTFRREALPRSEAEGKYVIISSTKSDRRRGDRRIEDELQDWAVFRVKSAGFKYIWMDYFCQYSRPEYEESARPMCTALSLLQGAAVCHVHLDTISWPSRSRRSTRNFSEDVWFRDPWRLEDLLIPRLVHFFDRDGQFLGSRTELAEEIEENSGIPRQYLENYSTACIAEKMRWGATRDVRSAEDRVFGLLSIFDVALERTFGDPAAAFAQLQMALVDKYPEDESIYAWDIPDDEYPNVYETSRVESFTYGLLAPWISCFTSWQDITTTPPRVDTIRSAAFPLTPSHSVDPRPSQDRRNHVLTSRSLAPAQTTRQSLNCWRGTRRIILGLQWYASLNGSGWWRRKGWLLFDRDHSHDPDNDSIVLSSLVGEFEVPRILPDVRNERTLAARLVSDDEMGEREPRSCSRSDEALRKRAAQDMRMRRREISPGIQWARQH